ncbi:MAG TPA: cardiolipin synthase [Kandleria vitulina]|nr:cardiolipin synthase [Kandleria vitulina]
MKLLKIFLSRLVIYMTIILIQAIYLLFVAYRLVEYNQHIHLFFIILSYSIAIYLVSKDENTNYKIAWILAILVLPDIGGLLYILIGNKRPSFLLRNKLLPGIEKMNALRHQDEQIKKTIINKKTISLDYLISQHFPIYKNTDTIYYSLGDYNYRDMLADLRNAKHFIFMEYFIVSKGLMFDTIFEILREKVKEGVDVRFIYDDFGSVSTIPFKFKQKLQSWGIKCVAFNRFVPLFSISQNHRDHRKICVIDGYIGYSGGFNIADEYINAKERFGHWKDTGIRLEGDAVWSLTTMFLSTFYAYYPDLEEDVDAFRPHVHHPEPFKGNGYVLPYGDEPLDDEWVGENVYLNLITHASREIMIMTPYFIIDDTMLKSLTLAAKNGVRVKVFTPHIPDKRLVFRVTRSYYYQLIKAGIEVYEYTPGFLHAKVMMVDRKIATVGTINFDYRSLYLHFECNTLLYQCHCIDAIYQDFKNLEYVSQRMTIEETWHYKVGIIEAFLRLISPLL